MRDIVILDAPSNLGLRPLIEGSVPGCYKAPWALREAGLVTALRARDAGVVVPPRYEASWTPGDGDRNAVAIADYSIRLADRAAHLFGDSFVLVLGGDCSILIGICMALRRGGRYGLAFVDGHSDFRHAGNAEAIVAAAGEDLAIVTGRGDERLIDLGGWGPYIRDADIVVLGVREEDDHKAELEELGMRVWSVDRLRSVGLAPALSEVAADLGRPGLDGFWLHLDVDVLDPGAMPAVDTPTPGGLTMDELSVVLRALARSPKAVGMDVCIFDPDLDPTGRYAHSLVPVIGAITGKG